MTFNLAFDLSGRMQGQSTEYYISLYIIPRAIVYILDWPKNRKVGNGPLLMAALVTYLNVSVHAKN